MKHKHYDMIVAKAADTRLITFIKVGTGWRESVTGSTGEMPKFKSDNDYFICMPKHKETCSHWLKGGRIEASLLGDFKEIPNDYEWSLSSIFMSNDCKIRIKPRKEKRWIGVYKNGATTDTHLLEREARAHPSVTEDGNWQFIEIEIEV